MSFFAPAESFFKIIIIISWTLKKKIFKKIFYGILSSGQM